MAAGEKCGPLRLDDGRRVDQRIKPDPFNGRLRCVWIKKPFYYLRVADILRVSAEFAFLSKRTALLSGFKETVIVPSKKETKLL